MLADDEQPKGPPLGAGCHRMAPICSNGRVVVVGAAHLLTKAHACRIGRWKQGPASEVQHLQEVGRVREVLVAEARGRTVVEVVQEEGVEALWGLPGQVWGRT